MEELMTVEQVSENLEKHPNTIRRYIKEGILPARKLAGKFGVYLIREEDVYELRQKLGRRQRLRTTNGS